MHKRVDHASLVLLGSFIGCVSTAQSNTAVYQSRQLDEQVAFPADTAIMSILKGVVPQPEVHGMLVGILERDGSRRVIAYGSAGPGGLPLNEETVLEIGSVSKAFLGVLLAEMVQRGEVELDEPLERLLPADVRVPSRGARQITLLDMATHTSGLPAMPNNFPQPENASAYANYSIEQMYAFLADFVLPREPGQEFQYSNLITLLGERLALRSGKTYEALLRERILEPLGMHNTRVSLTAEMRARLANGSDRRGNPQPYFVAPAFISSGSLKSTLADMLDFAAANLALSNNPLLSALYYSRQPRRPITGSDDFMGLGWGADDEGGAGLSGGTFGFGSYIFINSVQGRAVVVLANFAGREANSVGVHLLFPDSFPRPVRAQP